VIHLRGDGTDLVVEVDTGAPVVVHWGAPLGPDIDATGLASLVRVLDRPLVQGSPDVVAPVAVVPEHGSGFPGRAGLRGHRSRGRAWSPRFQPAGHESGDRRLVVEAVDPIARLRLSTTFELAEALVVRTVITNEGDDRYMVDGLSITLPLPECAGDLLTFHGRHAREFRPYRRPWRSGAVLAENWRGRTSHEHPPLLFAGTDGFGEWQGEVWGVHLAWSGNHEMIAERLPDGRRIVQLGELLHPGEVALEPGESYSTPEVVAVHSADGLTPATWGFHRHLRARPGHPTTPRPVLLNTWEAVYFDHDTERLCALATAAADVGIERFVLDDGWFGSRRDDRQGLGDWWVSPEMYPDGLAPLITHVRSLGMEFGIWVEPEMVNPDSDLYRAHPQWALTSEGYEPVLARNQLVLDLAHPEAYAHIFDRLDALLRDHDIAFVKWDMNRDHVQGSGADGAAGTHAQTAALYRLLDELGAAHPGVELESCSSGGARIDHEILRRTVRVWTSDCNDALERQTIQRGASMLIPPEVMGAHIGPTRSHTTGRSHTLGFRAATAMFGHLGVEWNVLELDDVETAQLRAMIELHKRFRPLLHTGDTVRFDVEVPYLTHGVYATDRSEALVSFAILGSALSHTPPPLRLPGLDPDRRYRVSRVELPGVERSPARSQPDWIASQPVLTGRQLAAHGVRPPAAYPESATLIHLTTVS
jgi:alpha-galactosidase